jgi:L-galactose dehydrogenase
MGLLGGRTVPEWHPATSAVREVAAQVSAICLRHGVSPGTLALQHCLEHPVVASTFTGFKTASEVADAIQALSFVPPPELLAELKRIIEPIRNAAWPSGLPENQPATPIELSHAR